MAKHFQFQRRYVIESKDLRGMSNDNIDRHAWVETAEYRRALTEALREERDVLLQAKRP